jgi:cell division septation protein DedD
MAQTEGEKEIVLGNKQLVSLFFVVVALLGVFFAAGYMIGRKSVSPLAAAANSPADGSPARETASRDSSARESSAREPEVETVREPSPAPVETQSSPLAAENAPAPEKTSRESKPVRVAKPERSAEIAVTKPETGATYVQVTALRHPEADNLVRSLREQNFPASLAPSSVDTLVRVLVGPYHETSKLADAKAKLKALGFAQAFVQK